MSYVNLFRSLKTRLWKKSRRLEETEGLILFDDSLPLVSLVPTVKSAPENEHESKEGPEFVVEKWGVEGEMGCVSDYIRT